MAVVLQSGVLAGSAHYGFGTDCKISTMTH